MQEVSSLNPGAAVHFYIILNQSLDTLDYPTHPIAPCSKTPEIPNHQLHPSTAIMVSLVSNESDRSMTSFTPCAAIKSEQGFWI